MIEEDTPVSDWATVYRKYENLSPHEIADMVVRGEFPMEDIKVLVAVPEYIGTAHIAEKISGDFARFDTIKRLLHDQGIYYPPVLLGKNLMVLDGAHRVTVLFDELGRSGSISAWIGR